MLERGKRGHANRLAEGLRFVEQRQESLEHGRLVGLPDGRDEGQPHRLRLATIDHAIAGAAKRLFAAQPQGQSRQCRIAAILAP